MKSWRRDEIFDGGSSIEEIILPSLLIDSLDRFLACPALKNLSVEFADKEEGMRMASAFNKQRAHRVKSRGGELVPFRRWLNC